MTNLNIKIIVENLVKTFLEAAKISLDLRKKGLTKQIKSDNTPVSNGDLEINKILISKLSELKDYVSKKCQTITYYGISKNEFKNFVLEYNLLGVDRIVPIGKSLEIDLVWDGYDVIKSLSREVTYK